MEIKNNDKRAPILGQSKSRQNTDCKTRQSQINYKCHIFKGSGNFRNNKTKFQKEAKLFHVSKNFSSFFLLGGFSDTWMLAAYLV